MKRSTVRANLFLQLGLVLLIAVLLNLLGTRYFKRLDLTSDRVHSLSQPTQGLDEEVRAAFGREGLFY